jgi:hypothetical protein
MSTPPGHGCAFGVLPAAVAALARFTHFDPLSLRRSVAMNIGQINKLDQYQK